MILTDNKNDLLDKNNVEFQNQNATITSYTNQNHNPGDYQNQTQQSKIT